MLKQIKKLTALLFVAATMFTFASCSKDNNDDNPSGGAYLLRIGDRTVKKVVVVK